MMDFLGADDYIIPSYGLCMPDDVCQFSYLPDRLFRFFKDTKTMTYTGIGYGQSNKKVVIVGIKLPEAYLNTLYDTLVYDCREWIKSEGKKTHMKYLGKALCRFGDIDFVLKGSAFGY
jgi:hypothetical protein